jgi:hypothetical protein
MHSKTLNQFLKEGTLPQSTREKSALFDELRSKILSQNQTNQSTEMKIFNHTLSDGSPINSAEIAKLNAEAAARRAARTTPAPVIHRAAAPVAVAKPVAAAEINPGVAGAAAFTKPVMTMLRSEWQALSAADKNRFLREGGKLVEPQAVKPHHKNGQLTRAGFDALTPKAKSEFFAQGKKIID